MATNNNNGSGASSALSAWINQIISGGSSTTSPVATGTQQNTAAGTGTPATGTGTPATGTGTPDSGAAASNANTNANAGTVVGGGTTTGTVVGGGTTTNTTTNTQTDVSAGAAAPTPAPETPVAQAPNRITADDIRTLYASMQAQQNNNIDYTVEQAVKQLQRAQQDAQPGFQKQHNQINIDEAQAKDAEVLYAAARGDRGGITARQYNSIMNTAAKNRTLVEQQRQQLATDTARQIEDLRAQGEFEKADMVLQIAQQQLAQLWDMQQYEDNLALTEAQLTGMYKGEQTYQAQEAERAWAYDIAMQSIKMGIVPGSDVLAAAGMNPDEARLMAYLYGETQGTSQLINRYNPSLGAGSGLGGSYGGNWDFNSDHVSGGGGGGSSGGSSANYKSAVAEVPYDKNVDYSILIQDAVGRGDLAAAALYEQQRNAKIVGEGMDIELSHDYADSLFAFDPDANYLDLRDAAHKAGDDHQAAIYEALRNAKIDYMNATKTNDGGYRKTSKYEDYLYSATNSDRGSGSYTPSDYTPRNEDPTPATGYYTQQPTAENELQKEKQVTLQDIADAAVEFKDLYPNVSLDSRTLDNYLVEKGYQGEAAAEFKGLLYDMGVRAEREVGRVVYGTTASQSTGSRVDANSVF